MIRIVVLGSTGSIGKSTLEVVRRHPGQFEIVGLSANRSADVLSSQVDEFHPEWAVIADSEHLPPASVQANARWEGGASAVVALARHPDADVVVNAVVGAAGLEPTLSALRAGKRLALANKESLVAGGNLVMQAASEGGGEIIPIDSEHSAILQCMEGTDRRSVRRIVLTASGGPFRGRSRSELANVTRGDALRHPTWAMGEKITVDSASLANKALEVIEAHVLYGLPYDAIDVVVHPQSIIHSFVEFVDGSVLAQLGFPTMELPILYALTYPERVADEALQTFDPVAAPSLTFEAVDHEAFPMFSLGVEAGRTGGTHPAVFNAANEVAVGAFVDGQIGFLEMAEVVEEVLGEVHRGNVEVVSDVIEADAVARNAATTIIERSVATGLASQREGYTGA